MRSNTRALGALGEDIAARHMVQKGMRILQRNYRSRFGEIDIVALDKNEIVFVEVKTRRSFWCGEPEEAVDTHKQMKLRMMAVYYLHNEHIAYRRCRFDVYAIIIGGDNRPESVRVLENCF